MQEKMSRRFRMMPDSETMGTATTVPNELSVSVRFPAASSREG